MVLRDGVDALGDDTISTILDIAMRCNLANTNFKTRLLKFLGLIESFKNALVFQTIKILSKNVPISFTKVKFVVM